jgi:hypothetical protein
LFEADVKHSDLLNRANCAGHDMTDITGIDGQDAVGQSDGSTPRKFNRYALIKRRIDTPE